MGREGFFGNSTPLKTQTSASPQPRCGGEGRRRRGLPLFCVFVCSLSWGGLSPALWGCCPPGLLHPRHPPHPNPSGCSAGFLQHDTYRLLFCAYNAATVYSITLYRQLLFYYVTFKRCTMSFLTVCGKKTSEWLSSMACAQNTISDCTALMMAR